MDFRKPTLITSYQCPDLDGYSMMVAYAELLRSQGAVVTPGPYSEVLFEVKYMLELLGEVVLPPANPVDFDQVILVDTSRLGACDPRIRLDQVVEVIDHRFSNDLSVFGRAKVQVEAVGAAATLIVEKFKAQDMEPSRSAAALLYAAIVSNTLNFQSNNTTHRDKEMANCLKTLAALPEDFVHDFFAAKSDLSGDKLRKQIIDDFSVSEEGPSLIGAGQLEIVGVQELILRRLQEIAEALAEAAKEQQADVWFLSAVDIEARETYFVSPDEKMRSVLAQALGLSFDGFVSRYDGLLLRKEYMPIVKKEFRQTIG